MSQASRDGNNPDQPSAPAVDSVLSTKLLVPPLRSKRVGRPRLIEKLNGGLDKPLILISAPAGYGKTTLVSTWLREIGIPSTWLSLEEDDNEPRRFLGYLVAALHKVVPSIPADAVHMLGGTSPALLESFLTVLINEISLQSGPLVLALDDSHLIHAGPILEALAFLIDHAPPDLHLVLLSRSDLPLPLARMRARDQILDVRAEDLRFDRQEVTAFLHDVMDLSLTAADIAIIAARTEGWIAGLQLAALSLRAAAMRTISWPNSLIVRITSSITWSKKCSMRSRRACVHSFCRPPAWGGCAAPSVMPSLSRPPQTLRPARQCCKHSST
jgi:LuxR family maltose regulon positive regulatory protein